MLAYCVYLARARSAGNVYLTSSRNLKIGSIELFRNPEAQLPDALIYGSAMPHAARL